MISSPTVLVLGAGSSMPYGFPSGAGLREAILSIHNQKDSMHALEELGFDVGVLGDFQRRFQGSYLTSIDAFLRHQPQFAALGKSCIAECVGHCEKQFADRLFNGGVQVEDWYPMLCNAMADGGSEKFTDNKLTIITFKYDRTIELFLATAYANTFDTTRDEALSKVCEAVRVLHVYGHLGDLVSVEHDSLVLGTRRGASALRDAQKSIRLIGDRVQVSTREECVAHLESA